MYAPSSAKQCATWLSLILLGVGVYAGTQHWINTRILYPVDMPISLAKGHTRTGPFRLNLWTDYRVYISIPNPGPWEQAHPDCNPYQHLQTRWVVYQNGKAIAWLDEPTTLPWWSWFYAAPGTYELDLEVLNDFRCADSAAPRLEVDADTDTYEIEAFVLKAISTLCMIVGFCSLLFVPAIRWLHRNEETPRITDLANIGQVFRWARQLPLRPPISRLPGFGLLAGMVFAVLAILMILLTGALTYTPKGLWVHLLKPGQTPGKSDTWTESLIVRLHDKGPGNEPIITVNSKEVGWDELRSALKAELAQRRDWTVYVGGDECIPWNNITTVIDIARSLHANVVLTTNGKGKPCESVPRIGWRV
jgi:biopolymer transport protein ExbD